MAVTMVNAVHSSSTGGPQGQPVYTGCESGYVIAAGDVTLYVAGDTDVMADMALFQELHAPTHAILPIGGHFTMDARRAAFAAKKFFDFKAVIPSHYRTFPLLAQSADEFRRLMDPVPVLAPEVMESCAPRRLMAGRGWCVRPEPPPPPPAHPAVPAPAGLSAGSPPAAPRRWQRDRAWRGRALPQPPPGDRAPRAPTRARDRTRAR